MEAIDQFNGEKEPGRCVIAESKVDVSWGYCDKGSAHRTVTLRAAQAIDHGRPLQLLDPYDPHNRHVDRSCFCATRLGRSWGSGEQAAPTAGGNILGAASSDHGNN